MVSISNSKNLLISIFIILIGLEIVVLIFFGIIQNAIGLSIIGSILSGTIVGVFVTFSQAKISASIYEESRVKTQHLDEIKQFLKNNDPVTLAKIMINSDEHKEEFFKLDHIKKHWPEFIKKMITLSEIEQNLQKNKEKYEEEQIYLKEHTQEIIERVNIEIEKWNQKLYFIPEFFHPGYNVSYVDPSGKSGIMKVSNELVSKFDGFVNNLINAVRNKTTKGEEVSYIFQNTLSISLSNDEKQFQNCIEKGTKRKGPIGCDCIIFQFYKAWLNLIGNLSDAPFHSLEYQTRFTEISDLKSFPEKFTSAVKESIQDTLSKEGKIVDIMKLIEQDLEFKSKENKFIAEVEEIKITIENSYFLNRDCTLIKE